MPNRNMVGGYRYAYQGQEVDPETGKEAFQLRLWDSRIGRWLTTDPYRQFASPYLGMGNNPASVIDPDGGFACIDADGNPFPCPDAYEQYNDGNIDVFFDQEQNYIGFIDRLEPVFLNSRIQKVEQDNSNFDPSLAINVGGALANENVSRIIADRSKYLFNRADVANLIPEDVIVRTPLRLGISTTGKTLSRVAGFTNVVGGAAGYYGAFQNATNGDYLGATTEGTGNTISILLAAKNSNAAGLAWTGGWEIGRWLSTTEIYNRVLFGVHSQAYKQRAFENGFGSFSD